MFMQNSIYQRNVTHDRSHFHIFRLFFFFFFFFFFYMNEDGCVCARKSESLFFLTLSLNESARRIKTPVVHVRLDLTTHSTILSHVGILAMLSWKFTGNVLSNCRLFDYLIYNFTSHSTDMVMSVRCNRFMEFPPTDIWMLCQARCALNYILNHPALHV